MNKIEELRPEEEETSQETPLIFFLCPKEQQEQRLMGLKLYEIQTDRIRTDFI